MPQSGPTPLVTQVANEPVSVSASEFRRHLFVAADAARLSDPSNAADLLAERVLQHMYALDAQTDPGAAAEAVQGLRQAAGSVTGPAFDARISRTMVLFQGAAAADQGPVAATLATRHHRTDRTDGPADRRRRRRHPRRERSRGHRGHRVALAGLLDVHADGGPAGQRHPGRRQRRVRVRPRHGVGEPSPVPRSPPPVPPSSRTPRR